MIFKYCLSSLLAIILLSTVAWSIVKVTDTPAPDVTFTSISGKKITLQELRSKPVLISFWSTDCPGCMKEIPHLIDFYNNYHDRGLHIIAVAMFYDLPNRVVAMTKDLQLPYDVALDPRGELAEAFDNVKLTPTTILIDPDGNIALHKTGNFNPLNMQDRIESML